MRFDAYYSRLIIVAITRPRKPKFPENKEDPALPVEFVAEGEVDVVLAEELTAVELSTRFVQLILEGIVAVLDNVRSAH